MSYECENKDCKNPCGCAEPVFSIEPLSEDPTVLRFNVNGKSVYYDFSSLVKNAETCTTLSADKVARVLKYIGECGETTITAKELGAILHLSDIGDINSDSIDDNGILNFRKDADCGEGCEGINNGWVATNPIDVAKTSVDYLLGTDADGKLNSLLPPSSTNKFAYLTWAGKNKAVWKTITEVSAAPVAEDGKVCRLYLDEKSGEIVMVRENA